MVRMASILLSCRQNTDVGNGSTRAQTMTEYALILAAVAIVVYVTYQVMGQDIGSMVSVIDSALINA
jgi:Flp pilus assembly pilin Flp